MKQKITHYQLGNASFKKIRLPRMRLLFSSYWRSAFTEFRANRTHEPINIWLVFDSLASNDLACGCRATKRRILSAKSFGFIGKPCYIRRHFLLDCHLLSGYRFTFCFKFNCAIFRITKAAPNRTTARTVITIIQAKIEPNISISSVCP